MARCSECGFLAVRNRDSYSLDEAGNDFREKGMVPVGREQGRNQYLLHEQRPLCFVRRHNLGGEIKTEFGTGKDEIGCVMQVIQKERECGDSFTEWQLGFTPKEHREMLDRKHLLEWQAGREKEDKNFKKQESQANRRYRILELVLVILTIGAILAAAFIGRGEPTINIITPEPPEVTIEQ